jgi:hypothetical protein
VSLEDSQYQAAPRQQLFYETFEEIADLLGKWDQGIGADGAHYVAESPFAEDGMVCANCWFYEGALACEIVDGEIAPGGVCKLWLIPVELLVGEAVRKRHLALLKRRVPPCA